MYIRKIYILLLVIILLYKKRSVDKKWHYVKIVMGQARREQ